MVRVLNERYLTLAEVCKVLEEKEKRYELSDIEQITLDYVKKFSKIDAEEAVRIVEKLVKEYGLSEEIAIQIVNILPESLEELRTVTSVSKKFISTEEAEAILKMLKDALNKER